ncbi:MAG: hypothetical protein ABR502_01930 [Chitinophagaceae bacterium]
MEKNFTNDNFERFLKQTADQFRMRPSDNVWEGIFKDLNKRRWRVGFASGALLFIASLLGYFLIDSTKSITRPVASASAYAETEKIVKQPAAATPVASAKIRHLPSSFKNTTSSNLPLQKTRNVTINSANAINQDIVSPNQQENNNITSIPNTVTSATDVNSDPVVEENTIEAPSSQSSINDLQNSTPDLLTIESVTNLYRGTRKKPRLSYQIYFTPTVSYRKLTENKSYLRAVPQSSAAPTYGALYDINNVVTHKPDIGLELGFAAKYPVTKNIKARGGLQFNINRYDIKAFNYSPEVATIALNHSGGGVDSLNTVTRYRNFNGYKANWLQNFYFQISAPIGVEFKVAGNDKINLGIASTVQPTYILGDRAYLLSADYKNYSEVPWLIRRWNVNTNLETFVSYSTGKINWQVGPQVRYQLLSSFVSEYPVKENLFDYGLKVGVSLKNDKK